MMPTIDYSQAIPNNVNLSSDRVLQRAPTRALLRVGNRTTEEVEAHQCRLASLPGDHHLGGPCVRLDQLPEIGLEQLVGHAEARARIEHLLREEEAVGAVEIADGSRWLRKEMER